MAAAQSIEFQLCKKTYRFIIRPGFSILCLFFFVTFCVLGNWQLHRYHYKKNLEVEYQQHLNSKPKPFIQIIKSNTTLQFQPVSIEGDYINGLTMLIQNQFYHDEIGYEVLTPVHIIGEKKLVWIDRGWVKQTGNSLPPAIEEVKGMQHLTGYIKLLDEHHFILGKNILNETMTPIVMQKMDIEELQRITHQTYYPFIVRLNAGAAHGYVRDWTITAVIPERHMGYAVQWFVMAAVLFIAYFCFCLERVPSKRES